MNIFALDLDPVEAARAHCDAHVVKMTLETAQLLSTVWNHVQPEHVLPLYRTTHVNHPCARWARENVSNYRWLHDLGLALSDEYTHRFGRTHASSLVILYADDAPDGLELVYERTPFALAMPEEFRGRDPVEAYRRYYAFKETQFPMRWTNRERPSWLPRQ